jgi:hypothetical protein
MLFIGSLKPYKLFYDIESVFHRRGSQMEFTILSSILPYRFKRHRYMKDGVCYDYLGQILLQRGYDIPDNCRTPADMKQIIPDFTFNLRGAVHNTPLTMNILALDHLDPTTHPQKLAELLRPIGIKIDYK